MPSPLTAFRWFSRARVEFCTAVTDNPETLLSALKLLEEKGMVTAIESVEVQDLIDNYFAREWREE